MKDLITLTEIHKLEERYPFNEAELEILVRCHEHVQQASDSNDESFLMILALSSPYSHYFLPNDTQGAERVRFLEDNVLPAGFANELKAAISTDAFVEYAHQHQDKSLERFIEGVADTGRRGSKQALTVLYNLMGGNADEVKAYELIDVCYRLAIASEAMTSPNLEREACLQKTVQIDSVVQAMAESLEREGDLTLNTFLAWAERSFPMLSTPLSTFVHHLLFHEHPYPQARIPFQPPILNQASDVFKDCSSEALLTTLGLATPLCGGKWQRLYSYQQDGSSFVSLEHSLLGYPGPTLIVARTASELSSTSAILGAFNHATWKDKRDFYGNAESFLFQLAPTIHVHPATGVDSNFMYLHSSTTEQRDGMFEAVNSPALGLGFGGCLERPRLFFPESLTGCAADFLDRTYSSGSLLPNEALERFEIEDLEVWAVGGAAVIEESLKKQEQYRAAKNAALLEAQRVHDKSFLAQDFQSGLIESKLFAHQDTVRGRQDFRVDDNHGGYKIEQH